MTMACLTICVVSIGVGWVSALVNAVVDDVSTAFAGCASGAIGGGASLGRLGPL
jgi:hypothetical protein